MDIIDGKKLGLWFEPPYPGCRKRADKIDLVVGHWTGGEADVKESDVDHKRVYTVLRNRHNEEGKPMPLSIHYIINSAGLVMQCADPEITVAKHAGKVNDRSIGIEIVNPGTESMRVNRPRKTITTTIRGKKVEQLAFHQSQLDAYLGLCELLSKRHGIKKHCPGDDDGKLLTKLLDPRRATWFEGFVEHFHVSSMKRDAGGQLCGYLLANGWATDTAKGLEVVAGKWPGDETDEELTAALKETSPLKPKKKR